MNRTDLFVDEAQYWFWGTDLALGYFSKPPLIAWIIRLSTEVGGDATAFWVRAPGPVMHAGAAFAVAAIGARIYGPPIGALSGVCWATLPAVTLGTQIVSTDTVMLPFFAVALWLWLRLAGRPSVTEAIGLGAALGLAFLGKYAAAYFLPCAVLAVLWHPELRIAWRDGAVAAAVFAALAGLNLGWNLLNEGVTFAHTADNVRTADRFPDLGALAEFVGGQFAVMGPIPFAAFVMALTLRPTAAHAVGWCFALPVLLIVSAQALRAGANLNWAAPAFVAATPMAMAWLARRPRWLLNVWLITHLLVAVALPIMTIAPQTFMLPNGAQVFKRVMGQEQMAMEIAALARAQSASAILADNRAILAALTHHLRGDDSLRVYAPIPAGMPSNHFELAIPRPLDVAERTLWATLDAPDAPPEGFGAIERVAEWRRPDGFFANRTLRLFVLEPVASNADQ
jgi:4-amino-4-deoxy-L-arabinose transferase-like glycosyltransferase